MRVAVNARRLEGQRLGVARYIEYLTEHWSNHAGNGDSVDLYLRKPLAGEAPPLPSSIGVRVLPPALRGAVWDNFVLSPRVAADVLFCPSYTVPLTYRGRSVVAIHSTNEIVEGAHGRTYKFTYGAHYRMSARAATRVIAPSETTRSDIIDHYAIPPERVAAIPIGVSSAFRPVPQHGSAAVRRRHFGEDRPYVVFVGKLSLRRNIPFLLQAFAHAKQREDLPHALLLFGPNHLGLPLRRLAMDLGIADSVVQTDGRLAEHHQLVEIYNAADAFVSASLYEGFSMPLVEALACGVPCVVAARGALQEIAGNAAVLIDDLQSPEAFGSGLARVITDSQLRSDLRQKGVARAKEFNWAQTAQRTWEVLAEAAAC